jgi:UDP-N-acetylmuramoylalanine--D-glutamate ligase
MKKVLILGYGASGKACGKWLEQMGDSVFIFDDKNLNLPSQVHLDQLKDLCLDYAIASPGFSFTHPCSLLLENLHVPLISEAEWAFQYLPQKKIAITGTNGKTTVTYLCEHLLNFAGIKAKACGNVAKDKSLASAIFDTDSDTVLVCELSSFQLERLHHVSFLTSCVLNVTPDHLDRYPSMDEYAKAKFNLQFLSDTFFVFHKTLDEFRHLVKEAVIAFSDHDFFMDLSSYAAHDRVNIVAAWNLLKPFGMTQDLFEKGVTTFKKPSYRFEKVSEISSITFINDSKATNVDATIQALKSLNNPTHLLVGGFDKGYPYQDWIDHLKNVKKVYCFGQAKEKIAKDLQNSCDLVLKNTMQEAIDEAYLNANSGETVLLSPGCSSFDAFIDYADRGKKFNEYVMNLKPKGE